MKGESRLHKKYNLQRLSSFMQNTQSRPYFMWIAVIDPSTCNKCLDLDGKVFHYTDPIWKEHLPPIHKGCRCRFRAFEKMDMGELNLAVSSSADYTYCFDIKKEG